MKESNHILSFLMVIISTISLLTTSCYAVKNEKNEKQVESISTLEKVFKFNSDNEKAKFIEIYNAFMNIYEWPENCKLTEESQVYVYDFLEIWMSLDESQLLLAERLNITYCSDIKDFLLNVAKNNGLKEEKLIYYLVRKSCFQA